jgi:hypothetical protein
MSPDIGDAVSTFCAEHGISRKSFYELRKHSAADGPAAVLEPRSRRPQSSPSKLSKEVEDQALQVRAALEASGLDHTPRPAPGVTYVGNGKPRGQRPQPC